MKSVLGRSVILVLFLLAQVKAAPDLHTELDCCITGQGPASTTK